MINAQKFEGKITYSIEYDEIPEALEAYEAMLPKESSITIKGTKSKAEQSMGGMGTSSVITDSKTNSSLMLISMMGQKMAVKMSAEEIAEQKKAAPKTTTKITKTTKKIAGYTCTKAIVTDAEGTEMIVWYTDQIPALGGANNKTGGDIKGFPMEYSVSANGMEMTMSVSKVSKVKIPNSTFDIPEGYEEMTMEELQESFGGMGGM